MEQQQQGEGPGAELEKIIKKILTPKELKHIKISSLRKGTLVLNVDASAWVYALNLKKTELLDKIKLDAVKEIRFRLGDIDG